MFIIAFCFEPFLILVPPFFPLYVIVKRQVAQVAALLVVLVAHPHVVPGEVGQGGGCRHEVLLRRAQGGAAASAVPLALYHHLEVLSRGVLRDPHIPDAVEIPAVDGPLRHLAEPFGERETGRFRAARAAG